MVRRFSRLFWPLFDSNCRGNIRKLILPLQFGSKIGSKEPENRQNINFERGLMNHREIPQHWLENTLTRCHDLETLNFLLPHVVNISERTRCQAFLFAARTGDQSLIARWIEIGPISDEYRRQAVLNAYYSDDYETVAFLDPHHVFLR
jgi:hypothetical protein